MKPRKNRKKHIIYHPVSAMVIRVSYDGDVDRSIDTTFIKACFLWT